MYGQLERQVVLRLSRYGMVDRGCKSDGEGCESDGDRERGGIEKER